MRALGLRVTFGAPSANTMGPPRVSKWVCLPTSGTRISAISYLVDVTEMYDLAERGLQFTVTNTK